VRVAGRRLRVLLELGRRRALVDDLRWLVRSLGPARDLDVLREALPPANPRFDAWLTRLAARARADARAALTSPRFEGLLAALRVLPPVDEAVARCGLDAVSKKVRRQLDRLVGARLEPGQLAVAVHALRRALRRLRYAADWLNERADGLGHLQDALGAVCDLGALARLFREYAEAEHADVSRPVALLEAAQADMARQLLATPAALKALR
jgi:CHAD domain-containing protein